MEDKDLLFLNDCSNDLLVLLADTLVYDEKGNERLTEELSSKSVYKNNYPNNMKVVIPSMVDELQRFGGNTILNIFRGHGVAYREILEQVAKRIGVNFNSCSTTELIEQYLLQHIFVMSIDKMTEDDVKHLSHTYTKEELKDMIIRLKPSSPLFVKLAGIIVLQLSKKFAQNAALGYLAKIAASRSFAVFAGPVAWALTAIWTIFDIAGPAYRVLVPCTITIAYMRQVSKFSDDELNKILG